MKTQNPASRQGLGEGCFQANLVTTDTAVTQLSQAYIVWLARRARLPLPTAAAVAAANGWGRT